MKVLVLGSEAKDHAIATLFASSRRITGLFVAPGNGGTSHIAVNLPDVDITNPKSVLECCKKRGITRVYVGYAESLQNGMADFLREHGISTLGAPLESTALEYDKTLFASFTKKHNIPTVPMQIIQDKDSFLLFLEDYHWSSPLIIKPAKNSTTRRVLSAHTKEELLKKGFDLIERFGPICIEPQLMGVPLMVHVLLDQSGYKLLPICGEYAQTSTVKLGHVIGGLSAVTPIPIENQMMVDQMHSEIIQPTLDGIKAESLHYPGIFAFSIMLTQDGPILMDYHTRLRSSAAEAFIPLISSDVIDIIEAIEQNRIADYPIEVSKDISIAVVVASKGFPVDPEVGHMVEPFYPYPSRDSKLFFHGVQQNQRGQFITTAGRCFTAVGRGHSLEEANQAVYNRLKSIHFSGAWYRDNVRSEYFKP